MNAVTTIENPQSQPDTTSQLLAMIATAAESGGVDKLAILVPMWERIVADARRVAFYEAKAQAEAVMRPIVRNALNKETHSRHATLDALDGPIRDIYTGLGFSVSFDTETKGNAVIVYCEVARGGFSEVKTAEVPFDLTGPKGNQNKSVTHAWKSALTYGRRATLENAFNLVATNDDDDGNAAGGKVDGEIIDREQAAELRRLIAVCSADPKTAEANERRFLMAMSLGDLRSIEDVRPTDFTRLRTALLTKRARLQQRQRAA